jgi:hypothetical protein
MDQRTSSPKIKRALLITRLLISEGRYSVLVALKNFVKILIGRKPYFDERRLFLWRSFLHVTGLRKMGTITCRLANSEGPGSQTLSIMDAINFARCAGLTYVHTPFNEIEHADRPMKEWAAAWETLFKLGVDELACETGSRKVVSYYGDSMELILGWDQRRDEIQRNFRALIPEFRRKYYSNKSPRTNEKITVAVHVRRGWDVDLPSGQYLFAGANSILRTITLVKNILDSHAIQHTISVYSEGSTADFAEIRIPGIEIFKYKVGRNSRSKSDDASDTSFPGGEPVVDIDAISAMREMIKADVLIMSKSSFSYCAAIISDGIKIFLPEQLRPIDGGLLRSEDGSFDCEAFERQLSQLIQANAASK